MKKLLFAMLLLCMYSCSKIQSPDIKEYPVDEKIYDTIPPVKPIDTTGYVREI